MAVSDSSVRSEYLDGTDDVVASVGAHSGERAVAPPLVLVEVSQGEVSKSGPADFDAVGGALEWLPIVEATPALARTSAAVQAALAGRGDPLAARDAFIAGTARQLHERLVVADPEFETAGVSAVLAVDVLG